MPRLPLNALAAFEAAARLGSMSRAAADLGLTHGAISRQVRLLEVAVGARLFDRQPRGLALTDDGRALFDAATDAFVLLSDTIDRIAGRTAELVVSAPRAFGSRWLAPRLGRFLADQPGLALRIEGGNLDPATNRRSDRVVIRWREYSLAQDPAETVLSPDLLFPVCAPALAAGRHGAADLAGLTLIHFGRADDWAVWCRGSGHSLPAGSANLVLSESEMVLTAAAAGQGVAVGRIPLVADDLAAGRLVVPFGPAVASGGGYVLAHPLSGGGGRLPNRFCRWLRHELAATETVVRALPALAPAVR